MKSRAAVAHKAGPPLSIETVDVEGTGDELRGALAKAFHIGVGLGIAASDEAP